MVFGSGFECRCVVVKFFRVILVCCYAVVKVVEVLNMLLCSCFGFWSGFAINRTQKKTQILFI